MAESEKGVEPEAPGAILDRIEANVLQEKIDITLLVEDIFTLYHRNIIRETPAVADFLAIVREFPPVGQNFIDDTRRLIQNAQPGDRSVYEQVYQRVGIALELNLDHPTVLELLRLQDQAEVISNVYSQPEVDRIDPVVSLPPIYWSEPQEPSSSEADPVPTATYSSSISDDEFKKWSDLLNEELQPLPVGSKEAEVAQQPEDLELQLEQYREDLQSKPEEIGRIIEQLKTLIDQHPTNAAIHRLLGDAYMRAGRFQEAIDQFNTALAKEKISTPDSTLDL